MWVASFLAVSSCASVGAGLLTFPRSAPRAGDSLQDTFAAAYNLYNRSFDHNAYDSFLAMTSERKAESLANGGLAKWGMDRPHCDKGHSSNAHAVQPRLKAKPSLGQFGSWFSKAIDSMEDMVGDVSSGGGVTSMMLQLLQMEALDTAKAFTQNVVSTAITVIPPMIPPPAWNNKPLACLPMVTGHNCFGAVQYLITAADFIVADVTDSVIEGMLHGFPATYAKKVGKTSDEAYHKCGMAYFSLQCSAIFPTCVDPQGRDEPIPVLGRNPTCIHLCVVPLIMCPGLWIGDIIEPCSMVSIPPICSQAYFWMKWKLPPQYVSNDEANPFPKDCPEDDAALDGADDPTLYESQGLGASRSQIAEEAAKGRPIDLGA